MGLDAVLALRLAYLTAAALILLVFAIRPLRTRFLEYGPRNSRTTTANSNGEFGSNPFTVLLDSASRVRVPHSWFASFYAVSVLCSLYWAPEILMRGPAFQAVNHASAEFTRSMTFQQVMTAWFMMFVQGSRRLYECLAFSKPSQSEMWVGHWALGVFFYIATSIAVWVEGIRKWLVYTRRSLETDRRPASIRKYTFSFQDLILSGPSFRTFIGVLIFILASGLQHDCHAYLASLKSSKEGERRAGDSHYRLPEHPAFNISLNPHYFAECLIYLAFAIVAAPGDAVLNLTMTSGLIFVAVNLGVTAHGTKQWYEAKFGVEKLRGKAKMIPLLY